MIKCFGFFICVFSSALAQDTLQVKGRFNADSVSVGEVISYSLTARYPRTQQVLFPDSTFAFAPFEINHKKFFATQTTGNTSYDSVVYYLTTFEIDSVLRLRLPIFSLHRSDCVAVFAPVDSIYLSYRVAAIPDSVSVEKLPLKTNTAYQNVQWIFNYPVFAGVLAAALVGLIVSWLLFGKRIRKYFALRKLSRNYQEFLAKFNRAMDRLSMELTSRKAEEALVVWKDYMEDLEKYPYTKFTSREIAQLVHDTNLDMALRSIDRSIYGGVSSSIEAFRFLQSWSQQQFQKKEAEVKNG